MAGQNVIEIQSRTQNLSIRRNLVQFAVVELYITNQFIKVSNLSVPIITHYGRQVSIVGE